MPASHNKLADSHERPRVLIAAPHPAAQGGVVDFVAMLTQTLGQQVQWCYHSIGRRREERGSVATAIRLVRDYFGFCCRVIKTWPDIIHLNPSMVPRSVGRDAVFLLLGSALRPGRVYVFIHGWDVDFFRRLCVSRIWRATLRVLLRRAAKVTVLSSQAQRDLVSLGVAPEKINVGRTMFDGRRIDRANLPRERSASTILFLSRVTREKGVMELLDAIGVLVQQGYQLTAVIAGEGPILDEAKRRAQDPDLAGRVEFPGYLRDFEKSAGFKRADIFVLPSYHGEGCPIALLEAMAYGLPVISTRVGGIPDILSDEVNGLLLDSALPATIAQALRRLIADSGLRARISEKALRDAWDKFEASIVSSNVLETYRTICKLGASR